MILLAISQALGGMTGGPLIVIKWINMFILEEILDPKLLTMIAMAFLE